MMQPPFPPQRPERRPKNFAEGKVWDWLTEQGWSVTKRGWPDFFCWKDDPPEILLVEVKPRKHHRLKRQQARVFNALTSRGIEVKKLSLDDLYLW